MAWQAARDGFPSDATATNKSAQINQFLQTHPSNEIYQGNKIVTPAGKTANYWVSQTLGQVDVDQAFTMSGTAIGRVTVPVLPVGSGADLQVSLYTDSAGVPGTQISTVRIPAKWITTFAEIGGVGTPLAVPMFNNLVVGQIHFTLTTAPATSASGTIYQQSGTFSGNNFIWTGGQDSGTNSNSAMTFTLPWLGGGVLGQPVPQPALPVQIEAHGCAANSTAVIIAGGWPTGATTGNNVYSASYDPTTGAIGSWAQQNALPTVPAGLSWPAVACNDNWVYVIGGNDNNGASSLNYNTVYYASISNGQVGPWQIGPPYPLTLYTAGAVIIGNFLVVAGGNRNNIMTGTTNGTHQVYYAAINADGSLGGWQAAPLMPTAVAYPCVAATDNAIVVMGGQNAGVANNLFMTLTFTADGPGQWYSTDTVNKSGASIIGDISGLFDLGGNQWEFFNSQPAGYYYGVVTSVPQISVPLPTTGLTSGATYHLVLHQQGGDLNNYLQWGVEQGAFTAAAKTSPPGAATWTTPYSGYSLAVGVFDQSADGQPLHTWDEGGTRISTLVYATTPDQQLLGAAESVQFADGTLLPSAFAISYANNTPIAVTQL